MQLLSEGTEASSEALWFQALGCLFCSSSVGLRITIFSCIRGLKVIPPIAIGTLPTPM